MRLDQPHIISISVSAAHTPRFLDYLGVALAKCKHQGSEGSDLPDGGFQEKYRCLIPISEGREVLTVWIITLYADGTLAPIEVSVEGEPQERWERTTDELVRTTLVDMVNGLSGKFFQRHFFAYLGHPLDGEYYLGGFRIAPSRPNNPFPFGLGEEVLILDLEAEGINAAHAKVLGKIQARKISSLLSVFLDIGLYTIPPMESRWFYEGSDGCKSAQLGYRSSEPNTVTMPAKRAECNPGTVYPVDRSESEETLRPNNELRCPSDIRVLFRTFNSLSPIDRSAFLGAASLFQIAMTAGRHYPTVHIAYCVAAVDCLTRQHTMNSFVELVCRLNKTLDVSQVQLLYEKYRSAHFHAGALPGGEMEFLDMTSMLLTPKREQLSKNSFTRFVHVGLRTVLIRWLIERATAPEPSAIQSQGS